MATKAGFDQPLTISGRMVQDSSYESTVFCLRTDLSINTSSVYGWYFNITGLQVVFSGDQHRLDIQQMDRTSNTVLVLASAPYDFPVGQAYDFKIVDDLTNVSVSIDGKTILFAATRFGTGTRLAFHSREFVDTATSIDFIRISGLLPSHASHH